MAVNRTYPADTPKLRLWPGLTAAAVTLLLRYGLLAIDDELGMIAILGGVVGALAVFLWWLLFSRAPVAERIGAIVLVVVAMAVTPFFLDKSIRTGMMGLMFNLNALPPLALAFVACAALTRGVGAGARRAAMVATILVGCGAWTLLRTDGINGAGSDLAWRWSPTAEEQLLAAQGETLPAPEVAPEPEPEPVTEPAKQPVTEPAAEPAVATESEPAAPEPVAPPQWPGFRGPGRDGVVHGLAVGADWEAAPPVEIWRRAVGPGWSSFAVNNGLLYTQEQRGEEEIVACYRLETGEPVWMHRDQVRFWESNAGAGPRGTPTLSGSHVYTFGGTGILNALDARTGSAAWSRDVAADAEEDVPTWGFSSSPLVLDDLVVVAAAGRLAAYDRATGEVRWLGAESGDGYSSPQLVTIAGVDQVLLMRQAGVSAVRPADGSVLWAHEWSGFKSLQAALAANGDLLLATGGPSGGQGIRRVSVSRDGATWQAEERWTTNNLKPYFNDFVVHKGHAYGFDGRILACVDLADGTRKWKGGRYGNGQLVLLAERDQLLVLSEEGELALVGATPDGLVESARFPAVEGKTWNHPAVVDGLLLVRNDREMAAFRLPKAD